MRSERSERPERRERGPARAEAAAALIFDPGLSAFVWANSAGLALFGARSLSRLAQEKLDRALPAAARLNAYVEEADGAPKEMSLDFWTMRGPVHLDAVVERLALGRDKVGVLIRSGGATFDQRKTEVILESEDVPPDRKPELDIIETGKVADPEQRPVVAAQCRQSAELSREEQETLREIARLIREGELTELPDREHLGELPKRAADPLPDAETLRSKEAPDAPPELRFDSDPMRLLAEVSHELRTPLTAIRGYGELIAAKPGDMRVEDRARHIIDAADHALSLIGDILDARQIASGQADLVFTDVDLAQELDQTVAMLAPQAAKAGVTLIAQPAPGLAKVVADARRVRQVLVNLVGNAIKFTGSAGTVRLGADYDAEGGIEVTVSDTGRGMGPVELAALARVSGERRRESRGIGLPLSRTLAEANGARLSIESRPGLGTVVHLSFPASSVVPP